MQGLISSVKSGSLADAAGIKAGESLLAVNGSSVRDIIDLSFCWRMRKWNLRFWTPQAMSAMYR